MVKSSKIIAKIEKFAPHELACEWDNSGWQVFCNNNDIKKVMLALNPDEEVINQAITNNCNLLITHHPLIFSKINRLSIKNPNQSVIIKAIQNELNIYSAHTNLDKTEGGTGDYLAEILGLTGIETIEEFVKKGSLAKPVSIEKFALTVKKVVNTDCLRIINNANTEMVKNVALCTGSGADFIHKLRDIDVYITGDVKYHNALNAIKFAVIDAGHFETEVLYLPVIKKLLSDLDIEIIIAEEKSPWKTL
ncbi:MAG: Nif3-like dinuclear metal center hexameric protein [bacterium]